jgi:hypothetical protein
MKGVSNLNNFMKCNCEREECGERRCESECEERVEVCCRPKSNCVDVGIETFTNIIPTCDPCREEEFVVCYKVFNRGPGVATNILLKSVICPAPNRICVRNVKHHDHFSFKNGIFTFCIRELKPCECVTIEVILKECRCENIRDFEIATIVEAKEEDIDTCNNFDFIGSDHFDCFC